jgi:hypothetical protein
MPRYGTIDEDYAGRLAGWENDGDIYMLNLMAYREEADYGPDGERGVSGREADDRYAPLDVLAELGANVCFFADVVSATEPWDRVAVVRYPTRRSFVEMQGRPDFQEKHVHKEAGMDHTTIVATLPTGGFPEMGELLLLEVWAGPTPPARADGGSEFRVEGTIIGDGRTWSGARYTPVAAVPDLAGDEKHQQLVVRPLVSQWR